MLKVKYFHMHEDHVWVSGVKLGEKALDSVVSALRER